MGRVWERKRGGIFRILILRHVFHARYSIPADSAAQFESVLRSNVPELFKDRPDLIFQVLGRRNMTFFCIYYAY